MGALIKRSFPKQAPRHQRGFLLHRLREDSTEGVKWWGSEIRPQPLEPLSLELTMQIRKEKAEEG